MRISTVSAAGILLSSCWLAGGQPTPSIFFSPSTLIAGSGPTQLHITVLAQSSAVSVRWNGADRPAAKTSGFSNSYDVQLTAEDVASPGMAEVSVVDLRSGATLASRSVFVGYNVVPNDIVNGIAFT